MADGQLNLSRWALLGGACAVPLLRHPGLDPESTFSSSPTPQGRWMPDQVRHEDAAGPCAVTVWDRPLARLQRAETLLAAAGRTEDDDLYDRIGARHDRALRRLLTTPAPHAAALADKIDLLVRHQAWEFTFADAALASLRQDARRLSLS